MNIDLKSSWMIGDKDSDLQAATVAGCKSIKIDDKTNLTKTIEIILDSEV